MSKVSEEFLTDEQGVEKALHMVAGDSRFGEVVSVRKASAPPKILVVCEHASNRIPTDLDGLGLSTELQQSHIAWDPGAAEVADSLASALSADLVKGCVSRLLYDCNRPSGAQDAIPEKSETHVIPGNRNLSNETQRERIDGIYEPFRDALTNAISARAGSLELLVTVHSFTPVFKGSQREVQIGILHGRDDTFARAMLSQSSIATDFDVRRNEPYGPQDGVAHTLDLHGADNGLPSVMIEVRSDLIANEAAQQDMARLLAGWVRSTMAQFKTGDAA